MDKAVDKGVIRVLDSAVVLDDLGKLHVGLDSVDISSSSSSEENTLALKTICQKFMFFKFKNRMSSS